MSNALTLRNTNNALARRRERETITIWNAQIIFRNFSGAPVKFNPDGGKRTFSVMLNEEQGLEMERLGWNVKLLRRQEEDDEQMYHLPVAISYKVRPPRVYMVTGDGEKVPLRKIPLTEELIGMMDVLDLVEANLVIAASNWEMNGNRGKKAYLQSFFGHIYQDELEQEYASVEEMVQEDADLARGEVVEGEVVE